MRKLCLAVLSICLLSGIYFTSCSKSEDMEFEPPVVSDVRINLNDTIRNGTLTLLINDSLNADYQGIDTVVAGKWLYISARFTDNDRLSTFKVEIQPYYVDIEGAGVDSVMSIVKLGQDIFGKKDTIVYRNRLVQIADTIVKTDKETGVEYRLALVEKTYDLKVVCMDRSGNRDSLMHKVNLIHRKSFLDSRLGE